MFTSSVRSPGFFYHFKINQSWRDSSEHCFSWNELDNPSSCGGGGHHHHRVSVISRQLMCTTRNEKLTEQEKLFSKRKHESSNTIAFHHLILPRQLHKCNGTPATRFLINFTILQEFTCQVGEP